MLGCMLVSAAVRAAQPPSMLRVLFLGDNGHHKPAERYKQLQPVLSGRRIDLNYTESLDDLSPAKLAGYDCLFIYANQERISPAQEKALLDFVEGGGGLAVIHCGSYCFLNSPKYIELVGGQFKSHGTGVFKETIVDTNHPVMHGRSPIESWDETYVHTKHNTNRVVLAERRDAEHVEPYTWVRDFGKGRVFYTAWGHDQRTWSNPDFQALVESGIRWASEKTPSRLQPRAGLTPFEYMEAPDRLPNYVAGAKWGTQADPIRTMQKPLAAEESMKHLVTLPDFDVHLFAAEPEIAKPIWMAWDERGRLWIAETVDYPNNMQPPGQGHDRIKICEDTDGDGRADKFIVFADKLSVPTGFVFANGGIIVVHSGKTEFLKDTDGDDKADVRQVLFSGWGINDTHAGPSNLRRAFDNWIWGTVGYSGFDGKVGGKNLHFGQGIYRFKPDGSALEFVRSSNNNTWGLGLSEDNLIFGSTANGNASMYMPIPNRYYEAVSRWSASRLESIADSQAFFALTDKVRQVDWHGKYTAGAGSALYTARNFPKEYWNSVQFVAEPTGHLLGKFHLEARGADFIAHNGRNFAASDDEWTSPICAEVGPDAALWVIDWYNYIVQHNPTPNGFNTGKGNAYETPLRDKTHGRIYRVTYTQAKPVPVLNLKGASPEKLVAALKNDNLLWRMTAQRMLVERGQKDVVPALCALVRDESVDELGLNPAAIHALWTLEGLSAIDHSVAGAVAAALKHPAPGVRRAAVTVLPRSNSSLKVILEQKLLADPDAQVRMATLLALSEMPISDTAGAAVCDMLQNPRNAEDRWIADAATCAAARHDSSFLKAVLASGQSKSDFSQSNSLAKLNATLAPVITRVTAHYAQRGPVESIVSTLGALNGVSTAMATPILAGLVSGWPQGQTPAISPTEKEILSGLMHSLDASTRGKLLMLAKKWDRNDLFRDDVIAVTGSLKSDVANSSQAANQRVAAAKELIALQDTPATVQDVLAQINRLTLPDLADGLIGAIAESRNPETAEPLIAHWPELTPAGRRAEITALLRRAEWSSALLDAIEKGSIQRTDLAIEQWSQLKSNPNRDIAQRAEKLSSASKTISADRAEIVQKLLPLAKEAGDAARGKEVFTANCAVCHTFNAQGGKVGPDLSGIGARDHTEILIDILDPNRSVEANYRLWNVSTKDGETLSGRLDAETQTTVEILDAAGKMHVIQRKEIERMDGSQLSIMPNGFETLPPSDLKALLAFLTQPHQ
jgi:putative membrane-bound dehydrogenase-like protein